MEYYSESLSSIIIEPYTYCTPLHPQQCTQYLLTTRNTPRIPSINHVRLIIHKSIKIQPTLTQTIAFRVHAQSQPFRLSANWTMYEETAKAHSRSKRRRTVRDLYPPCENGHSMPCFLFLHPTYRIAEAISQITNGVPS